MRCIEVQINKGSPQWRQQGLPSDTSEEHQERRQERTQTALHSIEVLLNSFNRNHNAGDEYSIAKVNQVEITVAC